MLDLKTEELPYYLQFYSVASSQYIHDNTQNTQQNHNHNNNNNSGNNHSNFNKNPHSQRFTPNNANQNPSFLKKSNINHQNVRLKNQPSVQKWVAKKQNSNNQPTTTTITAETQENPGMTLKNNPQSDKQQPKPLENTQTTMMSVNSKNTNIIKNISNNNNNIQQTTNDFNVISQHLLKIFYEIKSLLQKQGIFSNINQDFKIKIMQNNTNNTDNNNNNNILQEKAVRMGECYTKRHKWEYLNPNIKICNDFKIEFVRIRILHPNTNQLIPMQTLIAVLLHEFAHTITNCMYLCACVRVCVCACLFAWF